MKLVWEGKPAFACEVPEAEIIANMLESEFGFIVEMNRRLLNAKQEIYDFENGYGASSVCGASEFGWEIILIKFNSSELFDFSLIGDSNNYSREHLQEMLLSLKEKSEKLKEDKNEKK